MLHNVDFIATAKANDYYTLLYQQYTNYGIYNFVWRLLKNIRVTPKVMHPTQALPSPYACMVTLYWLVVWISLSSLVYLKQSKLCLLSVFNHLKWVMKLIHVRLQYWIRDCSPKFKLYAVNKQSYIINSCRKCVVTQHQITAQFHIGPKGFVNVRILMKISTFWKAQNVYRQHVGGHYC